jgi:hypothetical protein
MHAGWHGYEQSRSQRLQAQQRNTTATCAHEHSTRASLRQSLATLAGAPVSPHSRFRLVPIALVRRCLSSGVPNAPVSLVKPRRSIWMAHAIARALVLNIRAVDIRACRHRDFLACSAPPRREHARGDAHADTETSRYAQVLGGGAGGRERARENERERQTRGKNRQGTCWG